MDAAQALKAVEDAEQALEDIQDIDLRQAEALQAIAEAEQGVKNPNGFTTACDRLLTKPALTPHTLSWYWRGATFKDHARKVQRLRR